MSNNKPTNFQLLWLKIAPPIEWKLKNRYVIAPLLRNDYKIDK